MDIRERSDISMDILANMDIKTALCMDVRASMDVKARQRPWISEMHG